MFGLATAEIVRWDGKTSEETTCILVTRFSVGVASRETYRVTVKTSGENSKARIGSQ